LRPNVPEAVSTPEDIASALCKRRWKGLS